MIKTAGILVTEENFDRSNCFIPRLSGTGNTKCCSEGPGAEDELLLAASIWSLGSCEIANGREIESPARDALKKARFKLEMALERAKDRRMRVCFDRVKSTARAIAVFEE